MIYSYRAGSFTVLHSYNTAIVLEQELIFLGKPRFPLVLTRFRPTARLLRISASSRQRALQYQSSGPGIRSWLGFSNGKILVVSKNLERTVPFTMLGRSQPEMLKIRYSRFELSLFWLKMG